MPRTEPTQPNQPIKPSITALAVAMAFSRALAANDKLLSDQAHLDLAEHLWKVGILSLGWFDTMLAKAITKMPAQLQYPLINTILTPGYDSIVMLRKLMIAEQIKLAINNGTTQIVFLGGGYDIRSLVIGFNHPTIKIYELDRGPTREHKVIGLTSIPKGIGFDEIKTHIDASGTLTVGDSLYYIECDLAKDNLSDVLKKYNFSSDEKSLIIAEALTPYLSESDNQNLITIISSLLNTDSACLLSYLNSTNKLGRLAKFVIARANENFQFTLPPYKVQDFIAAQSLIAVKKFDINAQLKRVDKRAAEYYLRNPNVKKELFYLIQKSNTPFLANAPIPDIAITL